MAFLSTGGHVDKKWVEDCALSKVQAVGMQVCAVLGHYHLLLLSMEMTSSIPQRTIAALRCINFNNLHCSQSAPDGTHIDIHMRSSSPGNS